MKFTQRCVIENTIVKAASNAQIREKFLLCFVK